MKLGFHGYSDVTTLDCTNEIICGLSLNTLKEIEIDFLSYPQVYHTFPIHNYVELVFWSTRFSLDFVWVVCSVMVGE